MGERTYTGGEHPRTLAGPSYGRESPPGQPPRQTVVCYSCGQLDHFPGECAARFNRQGFRSVEQAESGPGTIKVDTLAALFDSNSEIESEILNNIQADNSIEIDSFVYLDFYFESWEKNIEISDTSVKGRLKHCYEFWEKTIDSNDEIVSIINQCYVISFISEPPVFYMKNNRSACNNSRTV